MFKNNWKYNEPKLLDKKRLWRTTDDKFIINSDTQLSCTDFRINMVNVIKDIKYNIKNLTRGLETIIYKKKKAKFIFTTWSYSN